MAALAPQLRGLFDLSVRLCLSLFSLASPLFIPLSVPLFFCSPPTSTWGGRTRKEYRTGLVGAVATVQTVWTSLLVMWTTLAFCSHEGGKQHSLNDSKELEERLGRWPPKLQGSLGFLLVPIQRGLL